MRKIIMMALMALIFTQAAQAKPSKEVDIIGLVEQSTKDFDYLAIHPDKPSAMVKQIFIAEPTLSYDSRWLRDNRFDVDTRYRNRIAKEYAEELREALTKKISAHQGLSIVDTPVQGAAVLVAQLKNVRINGPDSTNLVRHLVNYAGDAKLEVGLYHGDTLIAIISDYEQTRDRGAFGPELTSRVQNHRDFSILMSRWSAMLVDALWQ